MRRSHVQASRTSRGCPSLFCRLEVRPVRGDAPSALLGAPTREPCSPACAGMLPVASLACCVPPLRPRACGAPPSWRATWSESPRARGDAPLVSTPVIWMDPVAPRARGCTACSQPPPPQARGCTAHIAPDAAGRQNGSRRSGAAAGSTHRENWPCRLALRARGCTCPRVRGCVSTARVPPPTRGSTGPPAEGSSVPPAAPRRRGCSVRAAEAAGAAIDYPAGRGCALRS